MLIPGIDRVAMGDWEKLARQYRQLEWAQEEWEGETAKGSYEQSFEGVCLLRKAVGIGGDSQQGGHALH